MDITRLKELRKKEELSQRELAKKLNLSGSTIGMYEAGKRKPDSDTLQKIASFFDVSVDYLLGRTNERKSADEIKKDLAANPELLELWEEISTRKNLRIMFEKVKDLKADNIEQIIEIINIIEKRNS
ncbi:helix-turn-helix domain-containing protein [Fuchsiella alkaliacetigena]|uniref:helix-turn-helix domain-containing protein n=1 Tax=Fuchsiella alkaliacetigena TaxID=957042 RepID=UPI00200A421E|nr:helix-turn-helix transcriptional regulator [Fuchsiella alkaliacetigena]MCK8825363.1 helix-turn-helix transcriptional regulator [Fuchsiella alkaliacetigena]